MNCVIGRYCHRHGFVHGAEAEELRARIEQEIKGAYGLPWLQRVLDEVDARDSLAYVEARAKRQAADDRQAANAGKRRAHKATMDARRQLLAGRKALRNAEVWAWRKAGMSRADVGRLFNIAPHTVGMAEHRFKWRLLRWRCVEGGC